MIFLVMVVSQKSQAFQPDPRTPTIGLLSGEFTRPAGGETAFPHAIFGVRIGATLKLVVQCLCNAAPSVLLPGASIAPGRKADSRAPGSSARPPSLPLSHTHPGPSAAPCR